MIRKVDLKNEQDLKYAFPVVNQLRTNLNFELFKKLITELQSQFYELWIYEENSKVVGAMGMREYTDFPRGRHLYVDDLVVDEAFRSKKIGAKLLDFAEEEARKRKLPSLRLACVHANTGGQKFYERESWVNRGLCYTKSALQ